MAKQTMRIKDIALQAGVSAGTVDRVLHQRGEVSPESKEKVERVLAEIDYRPNVYASALAFKRKEHFFAYIMPQHQEGDYWNIVEKGIFRASEAFSQLNLRMQPFYFDQYDIKSFSSICTQAIECKPQGILFPPFFTDESNEFIAQLNRLEIPFSFFDSQIETPNLTAYFGQDSEMSGYLACRILCSTIAKGSEIILFHSQRLGNQWSTQSIARRNGFIRCIQEQQQEYPIHTIEIPVFDETEAKLKIAQAIHARPEVKAALIFNSRGYLIGESLEQAERKVVSLAFDSIDRNVACLKQGTIDFIIGQHPELQGYKSIETMCNALILKQSIKKINYMPLDILTADNIDYYMNFEY